MMLLIETSCLLIWDMSFWIKRRFCVAGLIFILPSIVAILMLYDKWVSDTDLLSPSAWAIISLGFAFAKIYYQVYEGRYQKLEEKKSIALRLLMDLTTKMENLVHYNMAYYPDVNKLSIEYMTLHHELCNEIALVFQSIAIKRDLLDQLELVSSQIYEQILELEIDSSQAIRQRTAETFSKPQSFINDLIKVQSEKWSGKVRPLLSDFIKTKREWIRLMQK
jgi:hypothetical protein